MEAYTKSYDSCKNLEDLNIFKFPSDAIYSLSEYLANIHHKAFHKSIMQIFNSLYIKLNSKLASSPTPDFDLLLTSLNLIINAFENEIFLYKVHILFRSSILKLLLPISFKYQKSHNFRICSRSN